VSTVGIQQIVSTVGIQQIVSTVDIQHIVSTVGLLLTVRNESTSSAKDTLALSALSRLSLG
jgi:hypothetical protein